MADGQPDWLHLVEVDHDPFAAMPSQPADNIGAANRELGLTPQENALYERHLSNLYGPGGVDNPDGSRSTLYQLSFDQDGRTYNVPTVYGGQILQPDAAIAQARAQGLNTFPSYASAQEAEARYQRMHDYMERDTAQYLQQRAMQRPAYLPPDFRPAVGAGPVTLQEVDHNPFAGEPATQAIEDRRGETLPLTRRVGLPSLDDLGRAIRHPLTPLVPDQLPVLDPTRDALTRAIGLDSIGTPDIAGRGQMTAQQRYRASQYGDERRMPSYERTGPSLVDVPGRLLTAAREAAPHTPADFVSQLFTNLAGAPGQMDEATRAGHHLLMEPPLPPPQGSYTAENGMTYPGTSDPAEWQAFAADQRARLDFGPTVAMSMIGGGAPAAERGAVGMAGGRLGFGRLKGAVESEPGYVYHATNMERAQDIAEGGSLNTHKPHEFTDQSTWPDGSTQKRNYFTPTGQNTWQFAPEEGTPTLLRIKRDAHPFQAERGTGDLYSTKPVPASKIEYMDESGKWLPLTGSSDVTLGSGAIDKRLGAANIAATVNKFIAPQEQPFIRAYHGSPHDFERFDMSRIGTGEGAQAYGHGLYFAENEATAKAYRDALKGWQVGGQVADETNPMHVAAAALANFKGDKAAAIENLRITHKYGNDAEKAVATDAINHILSGNTLPSAAERAHMYEVGIRARPEQFLDWDRALREQPVAAHEPLQEAVKKEAYGRALASTSRSRADELWRMVKDPMSAPAGFAQDLLKRPDVTGQLRDAGIPGIRYLDQGSRTAGEGSRNYVVFDDKLIDILRKYGIVGALGGAGAAGAAGQSQLPSQPGG